MIRPPAARSLLLCSATLLVFLGTALDLPVAGMPPARAVRADAETDAAARKRAIRGLSKQLRKLARSPHVMKKLDEANRILDGLAAVPGTDAGLGALGGAAIPDTKLRERIFTFAEENHDKRMLKVLLTLLDAKAHRRDVELKLHVVHALAVLADPSAIEPLSKHIAFDEDAQVVSEVCTALAAFAQAKIELRKIPVKAMVDLYGSTYNLMKSIREEDRLLTPIATKRWRVYARPMRAALQALTGKQWSRAHEWRRWWNDCKKARDWRKCKSKLDKK